MYLLVLLCNSSHTNRDYSLLLRADDSFVKLELILSFNNEEEKVSAEMFPCCCNTLGIVFVMNERSFGFEPNVLHTTVTNKTREAGAANLRKKHKRLGMMKRDR